MAQRNCCGVNSPLEKSQKKGIVSAAMMLMPVRVVREERAQQAMFDDKDGLLVDAPPSNAKCYERSRNEDALFSILSGCYLHDSVFE